jgi:enoyl-CoA hydratase/carnithine racemase
MKNRKDLNQECNYLSASRIDDIAWIELKGNILLQSTNLQCRDELIDYLDRASADESVKIVVIVNSEESTGYEKYAEFY